MASVPVRGRDGRLTGIASVISDIDALKRGAAALRESEERQAFLLDLSDALRPLGDAAVIQRTAARTLGLHWSVNAHYAPIETIDGQEYFVVQHDYAMPGRARFDFDYPVAEFPGVASGLLCGVMAVPDVAADPRLTTSDKTGFAAAGVGAYLIAPLVKNERLDAIFSAHVPEPRAWTAAEEHLMEEIAERTWAAVERTRVEGALRDSESRYRLLFETIDEGFCLCERVPGEPVDFRYIVVNPAFDRQSGLDYPVGKTIREIVSGVEEAIMQTYARVEATGIAEHFTSHVADLGQWFDVEAMPADQPGRIAMLFRNVTERRRAETALQASEKRLQNLIDGVPQLVWRADDGGRWTWASPQWTSFTGQREADSHGWGWLDPVHPDDRAQVQAAWAGAIERGEFHADYRLCHAAERRYAWFQTRATPVRDDADAIVEWLGTSTDVDDLRQLQDRQGVLVAELQHRTRNLITVVSAVSQQTISEVSSLPDFRERFGDRLSALSRVQGLLSHLSAGERVTFRSLIVSELEALGAPADKLTLDGPGDVPLRSATVQTFSLALHELATNALKYGALSASGGHLTVRWHLLTAEGEPARLRVEWRENGVDMTEVADRPRGGGYGRELIEHALPYQLDADTTYEMTAHGVWCTIDVPITPASITAV